MVVGGGDSACEEALYLTRFGSVVNLVHRRDQLQASKVMVDRVLSNPKIKITWNATVVEILGKEKGAVSDVRLKDTKSGAESTIEASGVFVAIGHIPNTKLLKGQLDMDEVGFIQLHAGSKTIVDGVFGAGDCADRQAITAAGRAARLPSTRSAFSQSPGLDFTAPSNARSAPHEQGIASDGDQVGGRIANQRPPAFMSEPKRQHYVPRFYLAGFCRDGERLWLRDGEKKQTRSDRPENAAVINHYYSLEKDGQRDNVIEKGTFPDRGHRDASYRYVGRRGPNLP